MGGKSAKRRSRSQPADILKAAAPFLKKRGTGAPVDQIMKATGLTSGALYSQFKNKDDLCTQAICGALDATLDSYRAAIRQHGKDGLRLIVERYLSDSQRGDVAGGCTFAALGGDMAKAGPRARRSYQQRIQAMIDVMAGGLDDAEAAPARRARAELIISTMLGALIFARAMSDAAEAGKLLAQARASVLSLARRDAV